MADADQRATERRELDAIVNEVVSDAHISRSLILPEEIDYIREHVLKKPLHVIHIWALGVGVVITGEYFGWNFGLPLGGPIGVLIASLIVCVLYLAWVLTLSELSVAMPFAGGPMAYGRRASGPWLGMVMGWSMFLESLFAAIGTALATGGYVAFLLNPERPDRLVTTACAMLCALVFFVVQYLGVREQAVIMLWLTYAAIAVLVWFWLAAIPGVELSRVFTTPLLPGGWPGVLASVPYALWWLVIIETVALASEEAHEPQLSIPRGMVLAQITLAVLVVLTWFFASASAPFAETGAVVYPLPLVFKKVWGAGWFLTAFSFFALAGMVVSYNGMIYATSRQSFSLGRAGYLPRALGSVHPTRRTPHVSLAVWTAVTIIFILFGHFYEKATAVAILISTLTAVIWYVLAVVCLLVLRKKEPALVRPYKAPVYPWMPIFVAVLSLIAGYLYGWVNVQVIIPTAALYAAAGIWYAVWARKKVLAVAPEEVAARIAQELARREQASAPRPASAAGASDSPAVVVSLPTGHILMPPDPLYVRQSQALLERLAAPALLLGLLSVIWMILRALGLIRSVLPEPVEILLVGLIWALLFVLISALGFASTHRNNSSRCL
ncbi:MAG TPA: amino acid permease [Bryobacterales bacterium]|nr:amino acid permease [Bryobacterales bacterium]